MGDRNALQESSSQVTKLLSWTAVHIALLIAMFGCRISNQRSLGGTQVASDEDFIFQAQQSAADAAAAVEAAAAAAAEEKAAQEAAAAEKAAAAKAAKAEKAERAAAAKVSSSQLPSGSNSAAFSLKLCAACCSVCMLASKVSRGLHVNAVQTTERLSMSSEQF